MTNNSLMKTITKKSMQTHLSSAKHIIPMAQLSRTLLFSAACALLLLPAGTPSHAQALDAPQSQDAFLSASPSADAVDVLYVSPQGSDSFSGQTPTVSADSGPFQTFAHAQEAISTLTGSSLARPVEVVLDPAVCPVQDSLVHWFSSAPAGPVIWHSDPSRTILIYTRTMAEQVDALGAEDYASRSANGSGEQAVRFYVSPAGDDSWTGLLPGPDTSSDSKASDDKASAAGKSDGPFRTLNHAQEAVNAFQSANPGAAVEVVLEEAQTLSAASSTASSGAPRNGAIKRDKKPSKYTPTGLSALKALAIYNGAKSAIIKTTTLRTGPAAGGTLVMNAAGSPRLVFAHYMVCNRDYGGSVAGYERDIQDAQAAGIDGFALNCGGWDGANYKADTASMFQAAAALNTGFKLFFSADMTGLSYAEVVEMMTTYANNPYYWHIQQTVNSAVVSRPVLSTWGGEGGAYTDVKARWQTQVIAPLQASGINVYFMPLFFLTSPQGSYSVNPTPDTLAARSQWA